MSESHHIPDPFAFAEALAHEIDYEAGPVIFIPLEDATKAPEAVEMINAIIHGQSDERTIGAVIWYMGEGRYHVEVVVRYGDNIEARLAEAMKRLTVGGFTEVPLDDVPPEALN